MNIQALKKMARRHWIRWRPKEVQQLSTQGKLDEALTGAAQLAEKEIAYLMKYKHYQAHEAEEVALAKFILLPPEGDGLDDWEREELEAMENEYRKNPPAVL